MIERVCRWLLRDVHFDRDARGVSLRIWVGEYGVEMYIDKPTGKAAITAFWEA